MADKTDDAKKSIPTRDHRPAEGGNKRGGDQGENRQKGGDAPVVSNTFRPPIRPPKKG